MIDNNISIKGRIITIILAFALVFVSLLTSCTNGSAASASVINATSLSNLTVQYDSDDQNSSWNSAEASSIVLNGDTVSLSGSGATADGTKVTITSAGTYVISGSLNNGQIIVDTKDTKTVRLVLNSADITCLTSSPIYIKSSEKTVLVVAEGTQNTITDGSSYVLENSESDEPNSAVFSKSNLTINGNGTLKVNANYNDGIASKDELKIYSGYIIVNSIGDGIRGKDFVAVKSANVTINSGADGIKSTNSEDTQKGFVYIEGNLIKITSDKDAIQAETGVFISGGTFTLISGGGSANGINNNSQEFFMPGNMANKNATTTSTEDETISAKAIKAGKDITINGGTVNVDSADDALHSNNSLTINGGQINITSGDDGIHSDSVLTIRGGNINIIKSYEGIESVKITINNGTIYIVSSDDGINGSGGNDGSSMNGRPGQNSFSSTGSGYIYINGGYVYVETEGDGIDVNGSADITGGTIIVNGPVSNGNGALDYDGTLNVTGGYLIAAGSASMAMAPSTTSSVYSVMINFDSPLVANTLVHIETEDGQDVITFMPAKSIQNFVLTSPQLKNGATYKVYYGGNSTGTQKDGIYSGGEYTGGTEYKSFTISSVVTNVGTAANMGGMGGMGNMGGGKQRPQQ